MSPEQAQAWLHEVEAMLGQHAVLTCRQRDELQANHLAARECCRRALLKANQLRVKEGRVVGPARRHTY